MRARNVIGRIEYLGINSKTLESPVEEIEEAKKKLIVSLNALLFEAKKFEEEIKLELKKVSSINRDAKLEESVSKPILTLNSLTNKLSNLEYVRYQIANKYK